MPRYGQYYGNVTSDNPWYDPSSKHPNWAGGMQSLLNSFLQLYQMKQQKEQAVSTKEMEQKRFGLEERRVIAAEKGAEQRETPEWLDKATTATKLGLFPDVGTAVKTILSLQTPEEKLTFERALAEARARGAAAGAPPPRIELTPGERMTQKRWETEQVSKKKAAKLNKDKGFISQAITRFNNERNKMYQQSAGLGGKEQKEYGARITNLENALGELDIINSRLLGEEPLSEADVKRVTAILANMSKVKEGDFDVVTGTPIETIDESAVPKGAQIATNPQTKERVVWIDGKWIKIKKKKK